MLWKPPSDIEGSVEFIATVVESKQVFWTNIKSNRLQVQSSGSAPSARHARNNALGDTLYNGCDQSKLCFGYPDNCKSTKTCLALFKASYDKLAKELIMEIHGRVSSEHRYFAVGLSDDEDMGDDSVTECVQGDEGVKALNSHNRGRRNVPADISLITVEEQKLVDGIASCRWRRNATTVSNGKSFDIVNNKYHVLLAVGQISGYSKFLQLLTIT